MPAERVQKIIAAAGITSRRKAEELISSGRVQVNGKVVTELGTKADSEQDHIRVDGKLLRGPERHTYIVLNKPKGYVTTVSDPEKRPTVMDLVRGAKARVYPVGRLDWASEGLLVLTNDGVVSGWDNREDRNPMFYELSLRQMQQEGVPSDHIQVAPGQAIGTYDESLIIREFAVEHRLHRLLIVTSGYHSRRALWSLRRACEGSGIEVGVDSAPPGWQTPSPWVWWSKRRGWKLVAGEYVKMIYYWTKY